MPKNTIVQISARSENPGTLMFIDGVFSFGSSTESVDVTEFMEDVIAGLNSEDAQHSITFQLDDFELILDSETFSSIIMLTSPDAGMIQSKLANGISPFIPPESNNIKEAFRIAEFAARQHYHLTSVELINAIQDNTLPPGLATSNVQSQAVTDDLAATPSGVTPTTGTDINYEQARVRLETLLRKSYKAVALSYEDDLDNYARYSPKVVHDLPDAFSFLRSILGQTGVMMDYLANKRALDIDALITAYSTGYESAHAKTWDNLLQNAENKQTSDIARQTLDDLMHGRETTQTLADFLNQHINEEGLIKTKLDEFADKQNWFRISQIMRDASQYLGYMEGVSDAARHFTVTVELEDLQNQLDVFPAPFIGKQEPPLITRS